jgi:hypothetical protein
MLELNCWLQHKKGAITSPTPQFLMACLFKGGKFMLSQDAFDLPWFNSEERYFRLRDFSPLNVSVDQFVRVCTNLTLVSHN